MSQKNLLQSKSLPEIFYFFFVSKWKLVFSSQSHELLTSRQNYCLRKKKYGGLRAIRRVFCHESWRLSRNRSSKKRNGQLIYELIDLIMAIICCAGTIVEGDKVGRSIFVSEMTLLRDICANRLEFRGRKF